jgi:hypothetical protein
MLAESPDKRDSSKSDHNTFVVMPERDPSMPIGDYDDIIRRHLGNQRCVIVPGNLEGPESFSKDEIKARLGPVNQLTNWHG